MAYNMSNNIEYDPSYPGFDACGLLFDDSEEAVRGLISQLEAAPTAATTIGHGSYLPETTTTTTTTHTPTFGPVSCAPEMTTTDHVSYAPAASNSRQQQEDRRMLAPSFETKGAATKKKPEAELAPTKRKRRPDSRNSEKLTECSVALGVSVDRLTSSEKKVAKRKPAAAAAAARKLPDTSSYEELSECAVALGASVDRLAGRSWPDIEKLRGDVERAEKLLASAKSKLERKMRDLACVMCQHSPTERPLIVRGQCGHSFCCLSCLGKYVADQRGSFKCLRCNETGTVTLLQL